MRYSRYVAFLLVLSATSAIASAQVEVVKAFPNMQFSSPIDIQAAPGTAGRLYVAERAGRIVVFTNHEDADDKTPVLDITDKVDASGEGGLLGFAFHPEFEENGYYFVYYTAGNPFRTIIARFQMGENEAADEGTELIILELEQPYSNHNGGQIRFGPDGYLYIALGDGGSQGDPHGNGQKTDNLFGSILRIDVNNSTAEEPYAIPADNPFVELDSADFRHEIYAYGLRNPYRFSFDAETGELWVADVGESRLEEVNVVKSGGNYGWNTMEGSQCFNPQNGCDTEGLELPVFEYGRASGTSITGGFVYRGEAVPELYGRYVYADFGSGRIWSFAWDGQMATDNQLIARMNGYQLITFGEDEHGELYIGSFDGNIYRFQSSEPVHTEFASELPSNIRLEQNYPNPFNPTTLISFHLPEAAFVELRIFDLLGQEVATLFRGYRGEGEHSFRFDASNLSGGIYIYTLITGTTQITRKMTLLK